MWDTNVVFSWCCYFVKMLMKPSSIAIRLLCNHSKRVYCGLMRLPNIESTCVDHLLSLCEQMFHTSVGPWMHISTLVSPPDADAMWLPILIFVCELRAQCPRIADADTYPLPKTKIHFYSFIHVFAFGSTPWIWLRYPRRHHYSWVSTLADRKAVDMLSSITRPKINQNAHAIKSNYDYWRPTAEAHRLDVSV